MRRELRAGVGVNTRRARTLGLSRSGVEGGWGLTVIGNADAGDGVRETWGGVLGLTHPSHRSMSLE